MSPALSQISRMGWKKDKYDHRDYLHMRGVKLIPDEFSLALYLPNRRDQGMNGSCVGFGIGGNLTATAKQLGVYTEWFSPNWIYNGARFIEGSLPYDDGAYPRDGFDWLIKKGCLLEHFWPYDPYKFDAASPPSKFDPEAAKHPLLSYVRVTGGVEGICDAIASGHFVSIGTPWFDTWMDTDAKGNLPIVTEANEVVGGHETYAYGYSKTDKKLLVANSWGEEWGDKGLFTMPFSAFDVFPALGGWDGHYVMVDWTNAPVPPEPGPAPSTGKYVRLQYSGDGKKTWRNIHTFKIPF